MKPIRLAAAVVVLACAVPYAQAPTALPRSFNTKLTGAFDLELQFTSVRGSLPGAGAPGGLPTAPGPGDISTIFTAVQEQLGLKLNAQNGAADVFVIDRVSPPSQD